MGRLAWLATVGLVAAGCYPAPPPRVERAPEPPAPPHDHDAGFHYASTNAIDKCEVGHVMFEIEATRARLWFVGPNVEKLQAVPLKEKQITLLVEDPVRGKARPLIFLADPVKAGKESVGRCSRFTASAGWLEGQVQVWGTLAVDFKGKKRKVRVKFPYGDDLH